MFNPFATGDTYMRQLFHCLQWYAGNERVKQNNNNINSGTVILVFICFSPFSMQSFAVQQIPNSNKVDKELTFIDTSIYKS